MEYQQTAVTVSVILMTYNQENYIGRAIESALMQKTNFQIEILIHDDASTDKTTEIIRSYQDKHPELIRPFIQSENQYSQGRWGVISLYEHARGKYIAICEGDDFWTDPLKLQKQVDFMEAHPRCSISCHKVLYHFEDEANKDYEFPNLIGNKIFSKEEIYGKYISATCSIMFLNKKINELTDFVKDFMVGDIPLLYFYLNIGDLGYIDERMASYRLHNQSLYHPLKSIQQELIQFDTFVKIKTRLRIRGSKKIDRKIINHGFHILEEYQKEMNYQGMRQILRRSFSAHPKMSNSQFTYYIKYSLIAFFPWLDKVVFRKKHESPSQ